MQKLKFNKDCSGFYATVKERVDHYFTSNNISKQADGRMIFKSVFFLGGTFSLYLLILSGQFSLPGMLILSIMLGMFAAFVGFNVCHDALHGSYSSHQWVNDALGSVFHLLGANTYNWKISHNTVHHMYTNVHEHDDDLIVAPGLIRVCPQDKSTSIQRYQHYYAFLLYGMASLAWIFSKDYVKFFQNNIGKSCDTTTHPRIEFFKLFFFKALYYFLVIALPLMVLDISVWQFVVGFVCMQLAKGLVLGLVFQLAHIVEDLEFPEPDHTGNIDDIWVAHQLRTTANFGSGSSITTFLCGGLNMQIEHHIFPKVCHIHYPAIAGIVKQTAAEFGLPYHENTSFATALASHFRVLKKLSRQPVLAVA
ncbi:MAG TPA: acyl-CoA desaturase [Ohtaekwangia sp.]|uniref:fatty acid desaturase family protein n=1 Tax=Ohtaekwangia sp. TaxID=2066019 RepID=UPI002F94DFCC